MQNNSILLCSLLAVDSDGDGIPDHLDGDDDGDGIPDELEGDLFDNVNLPVKGAFVKKKKKL